MKTIGERIAEGTRACQVRAWIEQASAEELEDAMALLKKRGRTKGDGVARAVRQAMRALATERALEGLGEESVGSGQLAVGVNNAT